ncbi:RNA polymerase sigma factor [Maribacter sp. 2304DJ31-5]|uniref:RNA polymerase sigma factor n=1 Tax=Maribacter sp. 2304DJ31-5 TaxID=3386273 RepID=UPI0039BCB2DC
MSSEKEHSIKDDLWAKFVNGEKTAFTSIYNQYVDALFAYGSKLSLDTELVKDCIQDIFIELYTRRRQLSEPRVIKYYLFKMLKNGILKKLKKERRTSSISELNDSFFFAEYNVENKTIDLEIDDNKRRLISKTLKSLTDKQQEILYLRFTMEFDYREISEIIGIDHNSVRKQVYRAIKKLRESDAFKNNINIILFYSSIY